MSKKSSRNSFNRLMVIHKPMNVSSNSYLGYIKYKYKNKKAGFSGTLDPFACGTLIVAFGQYSRLFNYLEKTPKTYRAVLWLGATSHSYDIENIVDIKEEQIQTSQNIQEALQSLQGEIVYTPPKFSAKKINGIRAYELARLGEEVELKESSMYIFNTKFICYSHPFITFEVTVSEGSYIRSFAQLLAQKLQSQGTLCYLQRLNEGKFIYQNEKELNPLDFMNIPINTYCGTKEWIIYGKKIDINYLEIQEEGEYIIVFDDFFSIIQICNRKVKYLLNKVLL